MSKKKIILIVIITILAVLAITGGIIWFVFNNQNQSEREQQRETLKIDKLYTELQEKQAYQMTLKLDDENEIFYVKKDQKAYIDTKYQGQNSKFIIKDGNSYLLLDDQKVYYTYQNNETDLGKIESPLEMAKNSECQKGKEKINKKEYQYEEYEGITDFLMKDIETQAEQTVKTRFYFNGNKLAYIKTIVGNYEETLKVDISYAIDEKLLEIPADYKEA